MWLRDFRTPRDVGCILNPTQAVRPVEGGITPVMGLALMEQIVLENGLVRNASFTDYVIPTTLDMPDVTIAAWVEEPGPGVPYDAKGIAEPTTIYFPAAVGADPEPPRGMRRLWGPADPSTGNLPKSLTLNSAATTTRACSRSL